MPFLHLKGLADLTHSQRCQRLANLGVQLLHRDGPHQTQGDPLITRRVMTSQFIEIFSFVEETQINLQRHTVITETDHAVNNLIQILRASREVLLNGVAIRRFTPMLEPDSLPTLLQHRLECGR